MRVLGIETSCDETGVAIYETDRGIIADAVYSQSEIHAQYGGVVPELASRDHVRKLLPLLRELLDSAEVDATDLDAIAYTSGPGLAGALLVGAGIGRSLAWGLDVPAIGVHHMEAHMLSPMLSADCPDLPFVALLVSGGHTLLVKVARVGEYELLGQSIDDACGEAFDKVAQALDLGYPGGPAVAKIAEDGDPKQFTFPRPMTDRPGLDFSFSGLKTAVFLEIQRQEPLDPQTSADIARGFEEAVVDTLVIKCSRALQQTHCSALILAGGVAANKRLRARLSSLPFDIISAPPALCTDNGAMIAFAGHERLRAGYAETPADSGPSAMGRGRPRPGSELLADVRSRCLRQLIELR